MGSILGRVQGQRERLEFDQKGEATNVELIQLIKEICKKGAINWMWSDLVLGTCGYLAALDIFARFTLIYGFLPLRIEVLSLEFLLQWAEAIREAQYKSLPSQALPQRVTIPCKRPVNDYNLMERIATKYQ